jgi:hypothetical protein
MNLILLQFWFFFKFNIFKNILKILLIISLKLFFGPLPTFCYLLFATIYLYPNFCSPSFVPPLLLPTFCYLLFARPTFPYLLFDFIFVTSFLLPTFCYLLFAPKTSKTKKYKLLDVFTKKWLIQWVFIWF